MKVLKFVNKLGRYLLEIQVVILAGLIYFLVLVPIGLIKGFFSKDKLGENSHWGDMGHHISCFKNYYEQH